MAVCTCGGRASCICTCICICIPFVHMHTANTATQGDTLRPRPLNTTRDPHNTTPRRERLGRGVARVARSAAARRALRNGVALVEMPSRTRARTPHARPRLNRSESASRAIASWRTTRLNAAPTGRATHRKFGEGDKNEIEISRRVSTP